MLGPGTGEHSLASATESGLGTKSPGTDSGPEASRVLGPGTGEPSLASATESGLGTLFPGTDSGSEASGEPGESVLFCALRLGEGEWGIGFFIIGALSSGGFASAPNSWAASSSLFFSSKAW